MELLQILALAAVQGVTEFLPISSNAHLILLGDFAGWDIANKNMRVAAHVGSLGAVVLFFRADLWAALIGAFHLTFGRNSDHARLAINLFVASVPVIGAGAVVELLALRDPLENLTVIAWTMLVFGLALWFADRVGMTVRRIEHMSAGGALVIGFAQVLALVPGVSRAGITMTAARMMGYERTEASRFAMLLSVPAILGAGTLSAVDLYQGGDWSLTFTAGLAAALSFAIAYASIAFLMNWLRRATFTPFVLYRVVVGGALLYWLYF